MTASIRRAIERIQFAWMALQMQIRTAHELECSE